MREQSYNIPQTFHMSLAEPVILAVIIPVLGIFLSTWLLIAKPIYVGVWVPIVILILCVLAIFQGMMMPTKMEFQDREIVINYLARKQTINVNDITNYFLDEEKAGRGAVSGTRSFVTLQLNAGKKVSFKNIKEGNQSLLESLEKYTGAKPAIRGVFNISYEKDGHMVQNKSDGLDSIVELSVQTEQLIQKLFDPSEQDEARQRLVKFGNDFYPDFYEKNKVEEYRLSALKKSKGNLKKLDKELAWLSPR